MEAAAVCAPPPWHIILWNDTLLALRELRGFARFPSLCPGGDTKPLPLEPGLRLSLKVEKLRSDQQVWTEALTCARWRTEGMVRHAEPSSSLSALVSVAALEPWELKPGNEYYVRYTALKP